MDTRANVAAARKLSVVPAVLVLRALRSCTEWESPSLESASRIA